MAKRKTRKYPFLTASRAKLIELIGTVLLVVLFVILAWINRDTFCAANTVSDAKAASSSAGVSMQEVSEAFQKASFVLQDDGTLLCPDGTQWSCTTVIDSDGSVRTISLEIPLYAKADGDSELAHRFNRQNEKTREMLVSLFDFLFPALGGTISDAEKFVQTCESAIRSDAAKTQKTKLFSFQVFPQKENGIRIAINRLNSAS